MDSTHSTLSLSTISPISILSQPPNSLLRRSRAGQQKPLQEALAIREKANSQTISRTSKGEREPGSITVSLYKGMSYPPTSELSQFREVSPTTWIMVIDGSLVFRLAVKAHLRFSAYFEQSANFFLQAPTSSAKLAFKREGDNVRLYTLPNATDQNFPAYAGLEREILRAEETRVTLEDCTSRDTRHPGEDVGMMMMLNSATTWSTIGRPFKTMRYSNLSTP